MKYMEWRILLCFLTVLVFADCLKGKLSKPSKKKSSEIQEKCRCGRSIVPGRGSRIINGTPVRPIYKYPWMVALIVDGKIMCGGAIIGKKTILTAAHCILIPSRGSPVGSGKCRTFEDKKTYCEIPKERFYVRTIGKKGFNEKMEIESFNYRLDYSVLKRSDIAILKTKKKIPCNPYTSPICLPTKEIWDNTSKDAIIAGWGAFAAKVNEKKILREANVEISNTNSKLKDGYCPKEETPGMHVCAKGKNQGSCFGDSGGPLMIQYKNVYYTVGITSKGSPRCSTDTYYTNVLRFMPWIKKFFKSARNFKCKRK